MFIGKAAQRAAARTEPPTAVPPAAEPLASEPPASEPLIVEPSAAEPLLVELLTTAGRVSW